MENCIYHKWYSFNSYSKGSLSSLAQNEYICMKLGKSFGLPVPDVDLLNIAKKDIFVVERYDRIKEADSIQRLHQGNLITLQS